MKKAIAKSLVLLILIMGSIYQVIMLWFDNVSDRNFFYSIINKSETQVQMPYGDGTIMKPRYIGVYLGIADKDFTVVKESERIYNKIYDASRVIVTNALSKGTREEVTDYSQLWKEQNLFFSYTFTLPKDVLTSDLDISADRLDAIKNIDIIGVIPATATGTNVKAYVVENNKVYMYSLSKALVEEENKDLNGYISYMEEQENLEYDSTFKNNFEQFGNDILLPLPNDTIDYNKEIHYSTPYVTQDGFSDSLEEDIDSFFINPLVKWKTENSDVIIYGDDKTIVKYSKSGILEYTIVVNDESTNVQVSDAYIIASSFLMKNTMLGNEEYFLSSYETVNGKTTFYFDYAYNSIPICLDNEILLSYEIKSPIEITVDKGKVVKLKRILLGLDGESQAKARLTSYTKALDEFVAEYDVKASEIDNMYLGYHLLEDGSAKIMWIIQYKGKNYTVDL